VATGVTAGTSLRNGDPRRVLAWALYDFGNSSFTTLVVTFVYATWFTKRMAADEAAGTALWSWGITVSALLVALLGPLLGARADRRASRVAWFRGLTLGTIALTVVLAAIAPPRWLPALVVFVAANTCYELAGAFYNAFLPSVAPPERMGRASGMAWGLGYAGGLLCLVGGLWLVNAGLVPRDGDLHVRATNLLVAAWFLVFSLPALLLLREPAPADPEAETGFARAAAAFRRLRRFPQVLRFLVARLVYNDGLVAIFSFGGIYAAGTFGFSLNEIILFGIVLNVAAGAGAFLLGHVDDRLGAKPTILLTLAGLAVATCWAVLARGRAGIWGAGILIGLLVGPNQASSRSLMSRLVPATLSAEFFGLYALSGKLTSFLGPFLLGRLTGWTGSQRVGVASLVLFFAGGALLLLGVDEAAGARAARAAEAALERPVPAGEP